MKKYGLSDKYMLISFKNEKRSNVSQTWLNKFQDIAKYHGIQCVSLPFSTSLSAGELESEIALPLNPIDWYALLKYSCGYIGNNMHPIVCAFTIQCLFLALTIMELNMQTACSVTLQRAKSVTY